MSENWLKILKEKMESYEAPVPDGLWESIEASMFPEKTRKTRILPWVWATAVAAALALGIFAGVRLIDRRGDPGAIDKNELIAGGQTFPEQKPSSSADNGEGQVSSKRDQEPIHLVPSPKRAALADVLSKESEVSPVPEDIPAITEEVTVPTEVTDIPSEVAVPVVAEVKEETEVAEVADVKDVKEVTEVAEVAGEDQKEEVLPKDQDDKKTGFKTTHDGDDWSGHLSGTDGAVRPGIGKPSAGVSFSSAAHRAQDVNTLDTRPFFVGVLSSAEAGTRNDVTIYSRTVSIPVTKDEEHRRPIRLSLSLDIPVSQVLSVETGLTYSILHSVFSTSSGSRISENMQTLGYLGIPLNLKANLWDKDWFTFYLTGGGMVEKCVSAVSKTVVSMGGEQLATSSKQSFKVKPLVWSLNASGGLQFNFSDSFGIYAEPGISYRFTDNKMVSSIYTEHPLDFVMSFGARFAFK